MQLSNGAFLVTLSMARCPDGVVSSLLCMRISTAIFSTGALHISGNTFNKHTQSLRQLCSHHVLIPSCQRSRSCLSCNGNLSKCRDDFSCYRPSDTDTRKPVVYTGSCTSHALPIAWPSEKKGSGGTASLTIGSYESASTWPGFVPCHRSARFLEIPYGSIVISGKLELSGIPYTEYQRVFVKQGGDEGSTHNLEERVCRNIAALLIVVSGVARSRRRLLLRL